VKLHKAAHTVYKTQCHIVWVTRYRRKILVEGVAAYLRMKLWQVQKYYPGLHFTELNLAKEIVVAAFSIVLGGVVIALAIAVGLGGRNIARDALERRWGKAKDKAKDKEEQDEMAHL